MFIKAPISVQWEITEHCNKRCVYCYNLWRENNGNLCDYKETQAVVNVSRIQNIVEQLIKNEVFSVTLTGGEPLLVFAKLAPYLSCLCKAGISVSLNSNLSLLTENMAKQIRACGIQNIICSLPAPNAEIHYQIAGTDTFQATVNGIKNGVEQGFHITVNMVVCAYNVNTIIETAKLAQGLGIKRFLVNPVLPSENDDIYGTYALSQAQMSLLLLDMIKIENELSMQTGFLEAVPPCIFRGMNKQAQRFFKKSCMAGKTFCTVGPDGQIRACFMESKKYGKDLPIAWQKIQTERESAEMPDECTNCPQYLDCQGGCRVLWEREPFLYNKIDEILISKERVRGKQAEETFIESNFFASDYCFVKEIKSRQEAFGGIFYTAGRSYYIDRATYLFFQTYRNTVFSGECFKNVCEYTEEFSYRVICFLLKKRILEICR